MISNSKIHSSLSITVARLFTLGLMGVLAAFSVLTLLAQLAGIPFYVYAYFSVFFALLIGIATTFYAYRSLKKVENTDYRVLILVFFIGLIIGDFIMGGTWALLGLFSDASYQVLPN